MKFRQLALYGVFLVLLGVAIGRLPRTLAWLNSDETAWTGAMENARLLIRDRYVEPVDEQKLIKGAIDGMVRSLEDPYSEFVPPAREQDFHQALTGKFAGIGARIDTDAQTDQGVVILTPIENSPALKAGLLPGDRIVAIEGQPTLGLPLEECVKRLKGEPGTVVKVSVRRPAGGGSAVGAGGQTLGEPFTIAITRASVADRVVKGTHFDDREAVWRWRLGPGDALAYIRVEQFTDTVAEEFAAAVKEAGLTDDKSPTRAKGLIIDLRDNLGGLLDQATIMADMFLDKGTIVLTRGRDKPAAGARSPRTTTADTAMLIPRDVAVVILINENSASASEVFAGALGDNGRALIVGARSFGKGLVQAIEPLPTLPGSSLKLTEQRFYLPSGRLIHRTPNATVWGVDPTPGFTATLTADQIDRLRLARRELDAIRPPLATSQARGVTLPDASLLALLRAQADWHNAAWVERVTGDAPLALAMRAITHKLDASTGNRWPEPAPVAEAKPAEPATVAMRQERRAIERQIERLTRRLAELDRQTPSSFIPEAPANAPASKEPEPAR